MRRKETDTFNSMIRALTGRRVKIDGKTPVTDVDYVVLDTELTGLYEKKDTIVSIGAIRMAGGKIDFGQSFYRLVKPRTDLRAESVVVHEITPSEVHEKPDIETVLAEFLKFCGDDVLVGHCMAIDLEFINKEMKRIYRRGIKNPVLDTYSLFQYLRRRMPGQSCIATVGNGFRLYDIAGSFGIPVNGGHNALMDAYITAQLFQRFIPMLRDTGLDRIGDLLRVGNPSRGGDVYRSSKEVCNL